MPFDFQKDFVEPTARVIEQIRGKKPEGFQVEKRRTAWERILDDDEGQWEKLKRFVTGRRP